MCSLFAPRAAFGFAAAAGGSSRPSFLDGRRGVAVAPPPRGVMAREPKPTRRVGATQASSAAPTQKRARDGSDGKEGSAVVEAPVVPASGQQLLEERMKAELDAVHGLLKKARLLSAAAGRTGGRPAGEDDARSKAAAPRPEAPVEAVAKRRKASPSKAGPEAAAHRTTEPVKQPQPPPRAQSAAPTPPQCSLEERIEKAKARLKMRRLEAIARAREKCRQEVLEMEKAVIPDETISPRDLEELGIAFPYAVTRTRRQALCCQT